MTAAPKSGADAASARSQVPAPASRAGRTPPKVVLKYAVRTTRLQLAEPLRISRSTMAARDAVRLTVEQGGLRGHGEAVSSRYLKLDTETLTRLLHAAGAVLARYPDAETALGALREGEFPALEDAGSPGRAAAPGFPAVSGSTGGTPPAVLAAVESALLDLTGKRAGVPAHRLLGAVTTPVAATARTIGISTVGRAAVSAHCLAEAGFRLLKIKAGSADPEDDIARARAVREHAPAARLLLDPNGAWTPAEAQALLPRYAEIGVEAVEQPLPPGDPETLARIAAASPLPVIADEDAATLEDVRRLAGRVQGVNVKLAECGGVHAALRIAELVAGTGTELMLGCFTASSLGIAPAVHLVDRARWADLDGHLLLAHDPWTGIGGADGTVRAAERAGLGVRPVDPETRPSDLPDYRDEGDDLGGGAAGGGDRADVA